MANTYTLTQTGQQVQDILDGLTSAGHARNLLRNWYLLNPVNQRDGHYIAPGVTYYSDSGLTTSAGTTTNYHNLTAFSSSAYSFSGDGTDGTVGSTYYVADADAADGYILTNGQYGLDYWKAAGSGSLLVVPGSAGATISNVGSVSMRFAQFIEPPYRSLLAGKTCTFSAIVDGDVYTATGTVTAGSTTTTFATTTVKTGVQITLASTGSNMQLAVIVSTGSSAVVSAAKLELGSTSSLSYDAPPDFSEELSKCQRLCIRVANHFPSQGYFGYVGYAYSSNYAFVRVPVPTTLYSVQAGSSPALSDTTISHWSAVNNSGTSKTISAITVYASGDGDNAVTLRLTGSFTAGEFLSVRYNQYGPLFITAAL